jgi:branched-chain amino acid transport system permease protein
VSAGLSLIFGVTRIVNFAHGSLYMLGAYVGWSLIDRIGGGVLGYWGSVVAAAIAVGAIGVLVEVVLLRRIYRAPELLQLIATFGVVLIVKDVALAMWGAEDLLGRRAPGLRGAVDVAGGAVPAYDLLLIALGPVVLGALWWLLARTRWGVLVRAATQDREMTAALGVNQALLFSTVFFLGSMLAGLGGALQLPREPANLGMDLAVISDVFVVTVVGGLGSIPGAYLAAVVIGLAKALCIAAGDVSALGVTVSFSKLTLVAEFVVMAVVLVFRPWGLLGRPPSTLHVIGEQRELLVKPGWRLVFGSAALLAVLALLPWMRDEYTVVLATDIAIFALFAASLHFLMGPGGMASFGHAAYFGLGAYGAALLARSGLPMEAALLAGPLVAAAGAVVFGWFCVRLSGVYLVGVWPSAWLADKRTYYFATLALCALAIAALWRLAFSPFGFALRAGRDSALRADAIGIDVRRFQWAGFVVAGLFAGLAGALYAFSKGSISPETLAIPRSVDGLVMVLLGGLQTLVGPVLGAALFTWMQDSLARHTEFWRALLGLVVVLLVVAFPQGIAGVAAQFRRGEAQRGEAASPSAVAHPGGTSGERRIGSEAR